MDIFYINLKPQENGDNEMHRSGCKHLANNTNRYYVGLFGTCNEAIKEAKKAFPQSNGCIHCCKSCHSVKVRVDIKATVG